jgi:hypothetical protein
MSKQLNELPSLASVNVLRTYVESIPKYSKVDRSTTVATIVLTLQSRHKSDNGSWSYDFCQVRKNHSTLSDFSTASDVETTGNTTEPGLRRILRKYVGSESKYSNVGRNAVGVAYVPPPQSRSKSVNWSWI